MIFEYFYGRKRVFLPFLAFSIASRCFYKSFASPCIIRLATYQSADPPYSLEHQNHARVLRAIWVSYLSSMCAAVVFFQCRCVKGSQCLAIQASLYTASRAPLPLFCCCIRELHLAISVMGNGIHLSLCVGVCD